MWADHGTEFFIHPVMQARPSVGSPESFRQDPGGSAQRRNSGSQVEIIMIKSDEQRERTSAQIDGFHEALNRVNQGMTDKRGAAVRGS
jgi:hypothetical protein